jgi:hypothetical protein
MREPEILLPVTCPVCSQRVMSGFRISVLADALDCGDIRLYASCHVASWEASEAEIAQIGEFLDADWSENLQ